MEEYCSVIVTPDSLRDGVEKSLIREILERTGSRIIWSKYLKIGKNAVRFLYPKKVDRPYYPSIVKNIVSGYSLLFIIEGKEGVCKQIQQMKGRFRVDKEGNLETDGLRMKYGARVNTIISNGEELKVYEFRLHTSDNLEGAALICALFMSAAELGLIKEFAPLLHAEAQKIGHQITV